MKYRLFLLLFVLLFVATACGSGETEPVAAPTATEAADILAEATKVPIEATQAPVEPTKVPIEVTEAPTKVTEVIEADDDLTAQLLAKGYSESASEAITIDSATYEAVLYKKPEFYSDYLLVYKEEAGQKSLLYEWAMEFEELDFAAYPITRPEISGWHDMNGDGWPELVVLSDSGGHCWTCGKFQIFSLQNNDNVINLTESALAVAETYGFSVENVLDLNGDGIMEWVVLDARYEFAFTLCHQCSPAATRIYAWDGESYHNASAQFPEYYQSHIDRLTAQLEELTKDGTWDKDKQLGPLGPLISLLLNYENAGRLEEGWAIFSSYANPERYSQISDADAAELIEIREQFRKEYGFEGS